MTSDKLVHLFDLQDSNLDSLGGVAKNYINGHWLECHFGLSGERNGYYTAIIVVSEDVYPRCRERALNVDHLSSNGYPAMFVDVTQLIKYPEDMCGRRLPFRSHVWLKRFDDLNCFRTYFARIVFESLPGVFRVFFQNGELCPVWISNTVLSQPIDCVIERGSQAMEQVACNEMNPDVGLVESQFDSMDALFNVILGRDGIGFKLGESRDLALEFFKVVLRPFGLPIGFNQTH